MPTTDVDLKILPSYIFYDNLDIGLPNDDNNDKDYWDFIRKSEIKHTKVLDILLRGFYYTCYMRSGRYLYSKRWDYLYYWMGDKVINNLKGSASFRDVMFTLNAVKTKCDGNNPYDENIFGITIEQFKKLKKVFDYLENYGSILQKIGYSSTDCTLELKKHVDDSFKNYNIVKTECGGKVNEQYCKMFQELVDKYQNDELRELTCNGTKDPSQSVEDENVQYKEVQSHLTGRQESQLQSGFEGETQDRSMHGGHIPNNSSFDNVMPIFFPILGIFCVFFILYKFTPFGTWLDVKLLRTKVIQYDIDSKETEELLENTYEFSSTNKENKEHHVVYYPIQNS
ncbi:PIR Superfamily Protein [Plasmodium ovale curtisi]|uniref:PIR Superfamily Protein n=1 Tax=Plasmodium ovale curtisi TaxID=864141 RepID=A0A1A8XD26_PLAOA|nr:PIR Superfamily Protein [Plasmodium ovale curtisi]SBT02614.1 PIR Superfamily Protein [Plasmodium ovale curtisi]